MSPGCPLHPAAICLICRHPGTPACLGADVLSAEEAREMLRLIISARAEAAPEAVAKLVDRCARLPLALRIAGELVALRTQTPLPDLVDELVAEQHRLDSFEVEGDPRTAVRSVFSWSYGHLPGELQTAFRLIGFSPARSFDPPGVAAVVAADLPVSRPRSTRCCGRA